jgi:hypothetical protein
MSKHGAVVLLSPGERRSESGGRTSRELTDVPQGNSTACRPRLHVAQGSLGLKGVGAGWVALVKSVAWVRRV